MKKWIKKAYLYLTLELLFPFWYQRYSKHPLRENKVIFIEANLPQLSGSLQELYRRLEEDGGYELCVHCLKEIYVGKVGFIKNALECLKDMATAKYIFLCEGSRVVGCIRPRPETKIVQVWHGCGAFKKFGFSTADLKFGGSREEYLKYSYYKNYDLVTVSSPEVVWAYEEAMNLKRNSGIVKPIGISRTDVFFQKEFTEEAVKKVRKTVALPADKKIILYAPTFRGSVGEAKAPDALDLTAMKEALGGEYVLLIKHHPVVKKRPQIPKECSDFALDVTETLSIEELLCASDLCISDYSSLIFEYSLFERPMIFFAYDLKEYGDWRGFYYDYRELTPGPVVQSTEEIIRYIEHLQEAFEERDQKKVTAFKQKFMSACDGNATNRLIEQVMERRV